MKILFLNPPSLANDTHDLAPPLWALILGAIAETSGHTPYLLDLNLETLDNHAPQTCEEFYTWATNRILRFEPDIICYSSMGLNGHVCLKLAELIKLTRPNILHFFGGPHFSAIAEDIIKHYPWIDAVFIGEGELALRECLKALHQKKHWDDIALPGMLTKNSTHSRVRNSPSLPEIPKPAYHLVDIDRYFLRNNRKLLDFEAGRRGCIYACRYCYAPEHFGQGERSSTIDRFIGEMADAAKFGTKHLFIVTDNFINYPQNTTILCNEIASARLGLTFNCYATLPQLNEKVISALAQAGCTAVYVGVDAVHPQARREFAKGLFRSNDDLLRRIDLCLAHGITPNLAFLLEEPSKGEDRFNDTVATAIAGALRGCSIAFNTLTVYPRTKLAQESTWQFLPCNLKARLCFDAPEVVLSNDYSIRHPHLFPFHSSHRSAHEQEKLIVMAHALKTLAGCAPEIVYELCDGGVLLPCLDILLKDILASHFAALSPLHRRDLIINRFLDLCERPDGAIAL